jgi:hypothetical protein
VRLARPRRIMVVPKGASTLAPPSRSVPSRIYPLCRSHCSGVESCLIAHSTANPTNSSDHKMPYTSKLNQEKQKWMTVKEAIIHIQKSDCCDEANAAQQLCEAIGDEAVVSSGPLTDSDFLERIQRPICPRLWTTASLDSERGIVCWKEHTACIDDVWVLKAPVYEIWKDRAPEPKKKVHASDSDMREALRAIFDDVESGKIKRWDKNDIYRWVQQKIDPKRAPKKEVWRVFEKAPEFAKHQRAKGRPRG